MCVTHVTGVYKMSHKKEKAQFIPMDHSKRSISSKIPKRNMSSADVMEQTLAAYIPVKQKHEITKSGDNRISLVLQVSDSGEELRISLPRSTSLGEIQKFLKKKYGVLGDYMVLKQGNLSKVSKTRKNEKVGILVKSSIGVNENIKLMVPKNVKIKSLKEGLAKKFGFDPSDFYLVHVGKK